MIAFDLDNTLADSKSPIAGRMAALLGELLTRLQVCVISGGSFEQFRTQLLHRLVVSPASLGALHLLPTCGTRYYRYGVDAEEWRQVYAEDISPKDKAVIVAALDQGAATLGFQNARLWGSQVEDRGSQVTFSALGQNAPVAEKEAWDPDDTKKRTLRDLVATEIPGFEVRVGGSTSIDVTRHGIDKAYGMTMLIAHLGIAKADVLFVGDRLEQGGNDHPVAAMGVDCVAVTRWQDTALLVETILAVT